MRAQRTASVGRMMKQEHGNMWLTRRHCLALGALALCPIGSARAATPLHLVAGTLALRGFDAVSYFFEGGQGPVPGRSQFELGWNARAWRFASAANREAFRRNPDIYAPRLRGFDPAGILEGRLVDADPLIYAVLPRVSGTGLYLFRNAANRARIAEHASLVVEAESRWPALASITDASLID